MRTARGAAALLSVLALATTAACTGTVERSDLERRVARQVSLAGLTAQDVTCPDLEATRGQAVTCTLTVQDQEYRTRVEVRSVDGDQVDYALGRPRPVS